MQMKPFLLHALSPLHAGTGHTPDIIDLPIARMKATGIPFFPGSSIKGVLREARKSAIDERGGTKEQQHFAVFGPEKDNAGDHAGALVVSDARLLALPVRSFRGTFAWVTSPLLLTLAKRDLEEASGTLAKRDLKDAIPTIPNIARRWAQLADDKCCVHNGKLYLEDLDLKATISKEAAAWAKLLAPLASPGDPNDDIFTKRFAIVDDETMSFLWETATQLDARVRIDEKTRTVVSGALWLEESLPPETLLIGLLAADRSRKKEAPMTPEDVLTFALEGEEVLQLGGKATTGRGRCRMVPFAQNGAGNGK